MCASLLLQNISVEVEEDGEVEWRHARVYKRLRTTSEFTAVICFPDGSPDWDFVETFRMDSEFREWRREAHGESSGVVSHHA